MPFVPLNNLLGESLKKAGIFNQVASAIVIENFSKIIQEMLGKEVSESVRGLYIKDRILTIACLHSVLAQEIKFREREILEKLNDGKKNRIVERIRYLV